MIETILKKCSQENFKSEQALEEWSHYMDFKQEFYQSIHEDPLPHLVSETNWYLRKDYKGSRQLGLHPKVGDICFIDFGQAYLNEVGFQHFAIVMQIQHGKIFVVPMTSNPDRVASAYDSVSKPRGKQHLMKVGILPGLIKESVLFLNDCKYINPARVIEIKGHLDPNSELFLAIKKRLKRAINL